MRTPEERKAAAAARKARFAAKQAERQAMIDAAKAKRRGALDDAKQATADTLDGARQAHTDALADGQAGVDAARARRDETVTKRDALGEQIGVEWNGVKRVFRETYAEEMERRRGER